MIKLPRSKIELLFDCPRCFWFYAGKGIARPFGAPYTINNAVDFLLKKEFDEHRKNGTAHYLITREGIDAIPYMHADIVRFTPTSLGINTAGSFAWYFDGSDVGLTTSDEDVDAKGGGQRKEFDRFESARGSELVQNSKPSIAPGLAAGVEVFYAI